MTMHASYRLKAMMQGTGAAVAARALPPFFPDAAGWLLCKAGRISKWRVS